MIIIMHDYNFKFQMVQIKETLSWFHKKTHMHWLTFKDKYSHNIDV